MMTPMTPFTPFMPVTSESVQLAQSAAAGNVRAMRDLLRELAPRIERVVRAILGRTHEDADDVIQQSLLGFVQALPSFRGECEPIYFASRVAARTAVAAARKRRAARARHEDGVDLDELVSAAPQPLADTERNRRMVALRDALAHIPPEQAETLALRIVLGWSLSEVAQATGVPINTVRSRLRLAKTALRGLVDDE
jgi:RNA polymerase sigma-70 factor (ECF subfamily)